MIKADWKLAKSEQALSDVVRHTVIGFAFYLAAGLVMILISAYITHDPVLVAVGVLVPAGGIFSAGLRLFIHSPTPKHRVLGLILAVLGVVSVVFICTWIVDFWEKTASHAG